MDKYSIFVISIFILIIVVLLFVRAKQRRSLLQWLHDFALRLGGKLYIGWEYEGDILNFKPPKNKIFSPRSGFVDKKGSQDAFRITDISNPAGAELFTRRTLYSWAYMGQRPLMYSKLVVRISRKKNSSFELYIMSWDLDNPPLPKIKIDPQSDYSHVYTSDEDIFLKIDSIVNFNQLRSRFNVDTTGWGQPFPDIIINTNLFLCLHNRFNDNHWSL